MKVLCVAGYHHSGKTTTVVELIKELRKRGHIVASIKDIHQETFTMEKEESNTWKHWEASDNVVFGRGVSETYQIWHKQLTLNEMLHHLSADYVVVEGMKTAALPKIICAIDKNQLDELVDDNVFAISGHFADNHEEYKLIPVISARANISKIADLVEEKVFDVLPQSDPECCSACGLNCYRMVGAILKGDKTRQDCKTDQKLDISIKVNGKEVKMVPFVQNIIRDTNLAMIRNLKGTEKGKIEISIND